MNSFGKKLGAAAIAGGVILAGSTQEALAAQGATLAETLGLPLGKNRLHFNAATQGLVEIGCEAPEPNVAICSVRTMDNQTLLDFSQTYDIRKAPDGSLKITTELNNVDNTQFGSSFGQKISDAVKNEWTAQSPLAQTGKGEEGESLIIQNDIGQVKADGDAKVSMSSSVPISVNFGINLSNVFDDARQTVQTVAVPMAVWKGNVVTAQDVKPASRAMDYSSDDTQILDDNAGRANNHGGVVTRKFISQLGYQ